MRKRKGERELRLGFSVSSEPAIDVRPGLCVGRSRGSPAIHTSLFSYFLSIYLSFFGSYTLRSLRFDSILISHAFCIPWDLFSSLWPTSAPCWGWPFIYLLKWREENKPLFLHPKASKQICGLVCRQKAALIKRKPKE